MVYIGVFGNEGFGNITIIFFIDPCSSVNQ
jgi:hypothetical protein